MPIDRFVTVPTLQLRPGMILTYPKVERVSNPLPDFRNLGQKPRSFSSQFDLFPQPQRSFPSTIATIDPPVSPTDNLKDKKPYSGQITEHSKKRLRKAINLLVAISEPKQALNFKTNSHFWFRNNFVTLTLPGPQGAISDKAIKKHCLDNWLKTMRRRHNLRSYVWRAERQFNGNVHFHITTDTYLPWDQIRDVWNHQLGKIGLLDYYEAKHNSVNPNSTDIHSIQKIKNLSAYMVKYMSKSPEAHLQEINEKRAKKGKPPLDPNKHAFSGHTDQPTWDEPIHGKIWDCSKNLKQKIICEIVIDSEIQEELRRVSSIPKIRTDSNNHCWMLFFSESQQGLVLQGFFLQCWNTYLSIIRNPPDYENSA